MTQPSDFGPLDGDDPSSADGAWVEPVYLIPEGHNFGVIPIDPGGRARFPTELPRDWVEPWELLPPDDLTSLGMERVAFSDQVDFHADKVDALAWVQRYKNTVSSWEVTAVNELREAAEAVIGDRSPDPRVGTARSGGWSQDVVVRRQLCAEVAAISRISTSAAEKLVDAAALLTTTLPETLHALEVGVITLEHAVIIGTVARDVPGERRGEFDTAVIPVARRGTLTDTRRKAREIREIMHPTTLLERHKTAMECREVRLEPAKDGMAYLSAYMPATKAVGIYNRLTETGRHLQGPDEERTLTQLRLDVLTDLLITGSTTVDTNGPIDTGDTSTGHPNISATVFLTIPALALVGHSAQPATLEGYGPIDLDTARQLAGDSPSWIRVLTDPFTGAMLGVGRKRKIPQEIKDFLRLKDQHCRFAGCTRPAVSCEIDHTTEYQYGGNTELTNLAHLCKMHHGLKTYTGWDTSNGDPATLIWRSATGHTYPSIAENPIGFVPADTTTDTATGTLPGHAAPSDPTAGIIDTAAPHPTAGVGDLGVGASSSAGRDDGWDAERNEEREQDRYPGSSDSDLARKARRAYEANPDPDPDDERWAEPDPDEPFPF